MLQTLALYSTMAASVPVAAYLTGFAQYYAGITVYVLGLWFCSGIAVALTLPMTLMGKRYDIQWMVAQSFGFTTVKPILGIEYELEGREHIEGSPHAVYLCNHQSMVDLGSFSAFYPKRCSVMAKSALKWVPFLGQFMWLSGTVFIDRGNAKVAMKSVERAGRNMRENKISIFVFPEGTRTLKPTPFLRPFKKGAFHLAVQAQIPIIPIVVENYWHLFHPGTFTGGKLRVRVLPPIPTEGKTMDDVSDLATEAREKMLVALKEISPIAMAKVEKEISESVPAAQQVPVKQAEEKETLRKRKESSGDESLVIVGKP